MWTTDDADTCRSVRKQPETTGVFFKKNWAGTRNKGEELFPQKEGGTFPKGIGTYRGRNKILCQ